jgi:hypothetical protein
MHFDAKALPTAHGLVSLTALVAALGACGGGTSGETGNGTAAGGSIGVSGGTIGSGSGGSGNNGGDGNGNGGGTLDPDAACLVDAREGEQVPIDLYFMVDITGSMLCPVGPGGNGCEVDPGPPYEPTTRWTEESKALKAFLGTPGNDGMGAGIAFFPTPNGDICPSANYVTPAVEIAPLPGVAAAIDAAIDRQSPAGNTPTVASLTGATEHASAWAKAHPERRAAVVYSTDGYPKSCGAENSIANAANVAKAALAASPSIPTYVLGVGPNLQSLDQIAAAGGTMKAYIVDTGQDVARQFAMQLNSIRSAALTCDYRIPASLNGPLDYNYVNVQVTPGGSQTSSSVSRVANAAACDGGAGGWYYDNPAAPSVITLCPATCDPLLASKGSLKVLIGCQSNGGPIN